MASGPTGGFDESRRTAPHVTIRGLSKHYPDAVIYDRFDFDIPRGKLISVFGPNGCGKSTLINMIAGLVPADAGEVLFDGQAARAGSSSAMCSRTTARRCFPWLPAFDNIAYPLKLMGVPKAERDAAGRDGWSPISASRSTSRSIPISCPAASSNWCRSCAR